MVTWCECGPCSWSEQSCNEDSSMIFMKGTVKDLLYIEGGEGCLILDQGFCNCFWGK